MRRSGRCAECGFDWDATDRATVIATIRAAPEVMHDAISRERPAPDVWSPLEYHVHLAYGLDFYSDRIDRMLAEARPQLTGYDFSTAAERDGYADRTDDEALADLVRASVRLAELLASLRPEQWNRVGISSDSDEERTVEMLARRGAHEVIHHAWDVH